MNKFKPKQRVVVESLDGKKFDGTVIKYHEFNDPEMAYSVQIDDFCDVMVSEKQLTKLEEQ